MPPHFPLTQLKESITDLRIAFTALTASYNESFLQTIEILKTELQALRNPPANPHPTNQLQHQPYPSLHSCYTINQEHNFTVSESFSTPEPDEKSQEPIPEEKVPMVLAPIIPLARVSISTTAAPKYVSSVASTPPLPAIAPARSSVSTFCLAFTLPAPDLRCFKTKTPLSTTFMPSPEMTTPFQSTGVLGQSSHNLVTAAARQLESIEFAVKIPDRSSPPSSPSRSRLLRHVSPSEVAVKI